MSWANIPLLSRLITRLGLNISPQLSQSVYPVRLADFIMPVTNVDELLRNDNFKITTVDIHLAADILIDTVPKGKRWIMAYIYKPLTTGNSAFMVGGPASTGGEGYLTPLQAGQSIVFASWQITQGMKLWAAGASNAADTARAFGYIFQEEDAY